jgi:SAM-dependent methyltransferase
MTANDPIQLLFAGMEKLGPGSDDDTLRVLRGLPQSRFDLAVDAGCGAGRHTIALARELRTTIHAIDSHQPFLDELVLRAEQAGVGRLIEPRCVDMTAIPKLFLDIDLLWSEGAAYNIGFANALSTWAPALRSGGFAVVSELAWLKVSAPAVARAFFETGYPEMKHADDNISVAKSAGYTVLGTHTLPREAWVDRYYEVLEPRARNLADHPDAAVRDFALETLKEIDVFKASNDSYGYFFYVLQRP